MIRAKRPAADPDGAVSGAAEANRPAATTTPDGSSADGDPNSSNPPPKSPPVSPLAAESPSPSPSKRPKPSPIPALPPPPPPATATASTSRRSDRKRKPRELLAAGGGGGGGSHHKQGLKKKVWDDPDEIVLLKAAIEFRSRTGDLPRRLTMPRFFNSIKSSISPFITLEQVGYKLKRLKGKYVRWITAGSPSAGATSHDRLINELSAQIWGAEAKQLDKDADEDGEDMEADAGNREEDGAADDDEEEAEEEEGAVGNDEYPFIKEAAENYWKGLGNYKAFVSRGLESIDLSKAKVLEEKLRKQCEAEALLLMKRLDLLKELSQLLVEANKSSRF